MSNIRVKVAWITRSVNNYFNSNYSETAVHYPNAPFDSQSQTEWVYFRCEAFDDDAFAGVHRGEFQIRATVLCARTSQADRLDEIQDAIAAVLRQQMITVYAYGTSSSATMGYVSVYEPNSVDMQELPGEVQQREVVFKAWFDGAA